MRNLLLSFWLGLVLVLALPSRAADNATLLKTNADGRSVLATELDRSAKAPQLAPGANDGPIAYMTAMMLEQAHYLHQKFDAKLSSRLLDRYLETLDPQHIHFLQSDIAEFETYRDNLGVHTLKQFDTSPAYVIYNRFAQRLEERSAYVNELLADGPMDFTGTNRVLLSRKDAPYPKNLTEAKQLWRDRLAYEYLQERLNKESRDEIGKLVINRRDPVALGTAWSDFHNDIVNIISRRYGRTLRNFREWDSDKVLEIYLTSLAHIYDPHSDFFNKSDLENFSISMSLQLFGIGAVLTSEDGYCKVQSLNPGPAQKSGQISENDRIVAVAQGDKEPVDVVDMPLNKVVELIRGPKGSEVRLTIIPANAPDPSKRKVVTLVRDEIKLEDQQAKSRIIELPDAKGATHRLGVIDLPSFYASFPLMGAKDQGEVKSTTVDVARLLAKLKEEKVEGVILDLRRNGGGSLEEAINLTGLFIKQGPVVQVRDPYGETQVDEDKNPAVQYDGPLIVLTSRFSASASEILAGALQDYGRALLVGDASTHGKGTVQSLNQLAPYIFRMQSSNVDTNDPTAFGALKITTRKFYRASGSSTQLRGVIPDIILPSVNDYLEVGEASLDNPLPWDTIESAKYDKLNRVQPYLTELLKRSAARVAGAKDFDYIKEDIEQVKKTLADKSVSLNEAQRLKEKDEAEARQKAREAEVKARKQPEQKVYEITLKDVDTPGLPAPLTQAELAANGRHDPSNPHASAKSAAATNSASTSAPGPKSVGADDEDEDAEDKVPPVDADLIEAEHILTDYISLLPKEAALTVNAPSSVSTP